MALGVLVAFLGCGDADSGGDADTPRPITLELRFRLGEIDGPAALNPGVGVTVGPDGLLYLTQGQSAEVTVFGADGRPRRTSGGPGAGPGEFSRVGGVGFAGDTLLVTGSPDKVALFELDGTLIREATIRPPAGDAWASYLGLSPLDAQSVAALVRVPQEVFYDPQGRRMPILAVALDGAVLDTLAWVDVWRAGAVLDLGPAGRANLVIPELDSPSYTFARNGTALVVLDRYSTQGGSGVLRATWIDGSGDTTAVLERPVPLEPFPDDVREEVISRLSDIPFPWGDAPTAARIRDVAEEQIQWPELAPAFTSMLLGTDLRLWLRREEQGDSARWEIWSPDDEPIEETWLPADLALNYADSVQVWGELWNELDVPFLYRYEIVR